LYVNVILKCGQKGIYLCPWYLIGLDCGAAWCQYSYHS